MKKNLTFILLLAFAVLLTSCTNKQDTYETFQNKHLNASNAFKATEEEYYLYFYTNNCPHCNDIKKIIFKQAKDKNTPLYFINNNDVKGILNRTDNREFSNFGALSFEEVYIYGFPTLLLLRDGRVIAQFLGSSEITKELT